VSRRAPCAGLKEEQPSGSAASEMAKMTLHLLLVFFISKTFGSLGLFLASVPIANAYRGGAAIAPRRASRTTPFE